MKRIILTASALLLATSAYAADPMVEVAPTFNWSGAYVGAQLGYAWGDSAAVYPLQDFQPAGSVMDPDGWLAGIYVGFNHQLVNNVVLGVEADVAYANIDGIGTLDTDSLGPLVGDTDSIDVNWTAALRARAGFAMGRFLPYVAGGIAFADIDATTDSANSNFDGSWNDTYIGYTVGAGAEFAVSEKVILRAEYRFTDFGDETFVLDNSPLTEHTVDLSTHDVRIGIAVKF